MERTKMTLKDLAVSFHFPKFSTSRDFYKAFGCRVCMLLSYQMISVYQLYIVEDYVHQTKTEAAGTIATMSIITMVVSLTASLISGPISDKMHTRKVPVIIASLLFFVVGFVLSQILFMGENAFDPDYLTFDVEGILINIVAPLIIVIIGDVLLVGQLKTANEATHADEYCGCLLYTSDAADE